MTGNHQVITVEEFPDEEVVDKLPGQQQPGIKKSVVGWVKGSDGEAISKVRVVISEAAKTGKGSIRKHRGRMQYKHTVPITLQIGNQTDGSTPFGR